MVERSRWHILLRRRNRASPGANRGRYFLNHGNPVFLDAPNFMAAQLPSSSPTNVSFGIPQTFTPLDTSCGGCPRSSEPIKVNGNPLVLVGLSACCTMPPGVILELSLERGDHYGGTEVLHPFEISVKGYGIIAGEGKPPAIVYGKLVPEWFQKSPEHAAYVQARMKAALE